MSSNKNRGSAGGNYRGERGRGSAGGRGRDYSGERRGGSSREKSYAERGGGHRTGSGPPQSSEQKNPTLINVKIDHVNVNSLEKPKKINTNSLIVRGTPGDKGTSVPLLTNYFPLKLPNGPFYQYAVTINPECQNQLLCYHLVAQHKQNELKDKQFVYDGQSILYKSHLH